MHTNTVTHQHTHNDTSIETQPYRKHRAPLVTDRNSKGNQCIVHYLKYSWNKQEMKKNGQQNQRQAIQIIIYQVSTNICHNTELKSEFTRLGQSTRLMSQIHDLCHNTRVMSEYMTYVRNYTTFSSTSMEYLHIVADLQHGNQLVRTLGLQRAALRVRGSTEVVTT